MADISLPHFGQVKISISYTLANNRAHVFLRALSKTLTSSGSSVISTSLISSIFSRSVVFAPDAGNAFLPAAA
jgi:hypothetical protein